MREVSEWEQKVFIELFNLIIEKWGTCEPRTASFDHGTTVCFYSICSSIPEEVVIGQLGCWDSDEEMVVNPSQDGANAGGTHDVCPRTADISVNAT